MAGQTLAAARRTLTALFDAATIETPDLDARLLIGAALRLDLTGLITAAARVLTEQEAEMLGGLAARRLRGEPIARIFGAKEFWGLQLRLSAATLVPRPDTETVVDAALAALPSRAARPVTIADLGTGSGAILLALLSERPDAIGIGTDISAAALHTACDNADRLGLGARAAFVCCDYAAALRGPFDLIVSNPPYIRSQDIIGLAAEVRDHDPLRALDGGDDGLAAYRLIMAQCPALLTPGGAIVVEIGQGQSAAVGALIAASGLSADGPPRPDLAGIPRAIVGRKTPR